MKRVTDPFDDNAKARIVGGDMTRPDYVSSGSDHSAEADDDDVTSSSLSALFFGCDAVESAAEDCDGADAELDRAMCDSISESVDLIARIVENEADMFRNQLRVQVRRAAEIFACLRSNKQMMRRNVMAYLRNCGYNAAVCKTNWPSSAGLSGGSYEFIDVDSSAVRMRYVVDLDFAAEFAIARPTSSYECLLRRLPRIYVGTAEEMRQILRAASSAVRCSLKSGGLILPPWRKHRFMQCKWLGPYRRTTNLFPSPAAENRVKCRAVGFDAAANGGLLVFSAASRTR
ncbi:hypothetical protein SASPL_124550 [Salvia splendens]|uniref:Uncharacterized protein n=1 Tax=Salvia splendens TaxID=180675 RepID=A0A8X8ZP07_SALSN|nr:uncharacterized protein LOC121748049 [Salvia splendens]KAG6411897.1 hypothetical protein SASPL_124550 [Salvia splendens]